MFRGRSDRFTGLPVERAVRECDALLMEGAVPVHHGIHRKRVEEFVRENNTGEVVGYRTFIDIHGLVLPFGEGFRHLTPSRSEFDYGEVARFAHPAIELA